jgi:hypothetical protein
MEILVISEIVSIRVAVAYWLWCTEGDSNSHEHRSERWASAGWAIGAYQGALTSDH